MQAPKTEVRPNISTDQLCFGWWLSVPCSPVWLRVSAALLLQAHGRVPGQQRPQQAAPVAGGPGELRCNKTQIPHCGHESQANTLSETGAFATILLRPEALPEKCKLHPNIGAMTYPAYWAVSIVFLFPGVAFSGVAFPPSLLSGGPFTCQPAACWSPAGPDWSRGA
jgi:hypothetical protein